MPLGANVNDVSLEWEGPICGPTGKELTKSADLLSISEQNQWEIGNFCVRVFWPALLVT